MLVRRFSTSLIRSDLHLPLLYAKSSNPISVFSYRKSYIKARKLSSIRYISSTSRMGDVRRHPVPPIPPVDTENQLELLRALEATLGSAFSSKPLSPPPKPIIIVISGPSGVGKDAVIKKLRESREGIHFVVTATTRPKREGEVEGKDYYFVSKEEFLEMISRNELLEYAMVYGDYKGIPKQRIREYMAMGNDIVLRVDIQGASTLRKIFGNSAVFIFLVAESELALVKRLVDRKSETKETLLVRIATAREEMKHMKNFDYVVVNEQGKLDDTVKLVESIIDAEKAKVQQRSAVV